MEIACQEKTGRVHSRACIPYLVAMIEICIPHGVT